MRCFVMFVTALCILFLLNQDLSLLSLSIFVIPCCHQFSWPVSILHLRMRRCRGWSCDNTQGSFHCQSAACRLYFLANWWMKIRYFRYKSSVFYCLVIGSQSKLSLEKFQANRYFLTIYDQISRPSLHSFKDFSSPGKNKTLRSWQKSISGF